jgi:hypothetical protein
MTSRRNLILSTVFLVIANVLLLISGFQIITPTAAEAVRASTPVFDPSYILSDESFRSQRVFPTEQSVQDYLVKVNSPLKNYTDNGHTASYWIYTAAIGTTSNKGYVTPNLNAALLLVFLDKEQSLLSLSNYDTVSDPEKRLQAAMGYGCPDGSVCNPIYKGFSNQVTWAAYQLEYNYRLATGQIPGEQVYKIGSTITTGDGVTVTIGNAATAAMYRYTPHVYWGNYNVWKFMTSYGWGVSSDTYTFAELDGTSLGGKTINPSNEPTVTFVSFDSIKQIISSNISIGATNSSIVDLQQYLRQEGYFTFATNTGYYGPITQTAHESWKKDNVAKLTNSCSELENRTWVYGQTGQDVTALQKCLQDKGVFKWPSGVTGYIGNYTLSLLSNSAGCNEIIISAKQWTTGKSGAEVVKLQQCLTNQGLFKWPSGVTGYYGTYTSGLIK